jgi:hypothetical protein
MQLAGIRHADWRDWYRMWRKMDLGEKGVCFTYTSAVKRLV